MNKIEINDFLEPFKNKKKFTFFIFISIFLILTFEILLKKVETKIYVTNIDLKFSEIESMKYILEYTHKRKNIVRIIFWEIDDEKEFRNLWHEANSFVKRMRKSSSYIELKKNKDRSDRFRVQIKSKDISINKALESIIYPKFNNVITNLYLEDLKTSLREEKKLEQNSIEKVLINYQNQRNSMKNQIIFIENVIEKKIDENKKNKLVEQKALEYKKRELERVENKFNNWYKGHQKVKEQIKVKNFISKEEFEELISLSKNDIKIKYILQILSFIISYTLVLVYSLKTKYNSNA